MFFADLAITLNTPVTLKILGAESQKSASGKKFILIRLYNDEGVLVTRTFAGTTKAQQEMLGKTLISPVLGQLKVFSCKDVDDFVKVVNDHKDAEIQVMAVPQEDTGYVNYIWAPAQMKAQADDNLDF